MAANVRIQPESYERLRRMADRTGVSLGEVLTQAIDSHYRKWLLAGLASDYARLKESPRQWADELADRRAWDRTLGDGLEDL